MKQKTVILTFDDACITHRDLVAPTLKKFGFGGTFFISMPQNWLTEAPEAYLNWDDIAGLAHQGFDIGNHTMNHAFLPELNDEECRKELDLLNKKFAEYGIPRPVSFAYPGGPYAANAVKALQECGLKYARTTEPGLWEPGQSDPMRLPCFVITEEHKANFQEAVKLTSGNANAAAIILYHGIPDLHHPWCNTSETTFLEQMEFLADNGFRVLSMRDFGAMQYPQTDRYE